MELPDCRWLQEWWKVRPPCKNEGRIGATLSLFLLWTISRFLGYVDLQGTTYQSSTIATGYGAYIAQPLLRKAVEGREDTLTEQEAIKLLDDCMRVLYYRDARSLNKARASERWETVQLPVDPLSWSSYHSIDSTSHCDWQGYYHYGTVWARDGLGLCRYALVYTIPYRLLNWCPALPCTALPCTATHCNATQNIEYIRGYGATYGQ